MSAPGPTTTPRTMFSGPIEPVRTALGYRVALTLVALLMLLLPVVYFSIIVAAGAGVTWHAITNITLFETVKDKRGAFIAYVTPLIAGTLIVVLLAKPLLARRPRRSTTYELEPSQHPQLFAFANAVADAVGAPRPRRIKVACMVNASASFSRGFLSLFTNDLTLTIGTPLVAGMTARQFAGVLAHEFGHFAQGGGMRLTWLIFSINTWFARVVYERDSWDRGLRQVAARAPHVAITAVVWLCLALIFLVRRVLWLLMKVSELLSFHMLRQMEYDADQYEVRIAGTEDFARTFVELARLNAAFNLVMSELEGAYAQKRLPDNVPLLVAERAAALPVEGAQRMFEAEKGSWFDTHPATRQRIAAASRTPTPGVFTLDAPAAALFDDFPILAKWTTLGLYKEIDEDITGDMLVPTEEVSRRHRMDGEARVAAARFYTSLLHTDLLHFPTPTEATLLRTEPPTRELVEAARRRTESTAADARETFAGLMDADQRRMRSAQAQLSVDAARATGRKRQADREQADAHGLRRQAEADLASGYRRLGPWSESLGDRIHMAMVFLESRDADRSGRAATAARHMRALLDSLRAIQEVHGTLEACGLHLSAYASLLNAIASDSSAMEHGEFAALVRRYADRVHTDCAAILARLRGCEFPLRTGGETISIGDYILPKLPPVENLGDLGHAASQVQRRTRDLYLQIMSRLALFTERAERAMGFEPLAAGDAEGA